MFGEGIAPLTATPEPRVRAVPYVALQGTGLSSAPCSVNPPTSHTVLLPRIFFHFIPPNPVPHPSPTHSHTRVLDGLSAADSEARADNAPSPSYGKCQTLPTHRRSGLCRVAAPVK